MTSKKELRDMVFALENRLDDLVKDTLESRWKLLGLEARVRTVEGALQDKATHLLVTDNTGKE